MNENLTELVFILDRSGSMAGREQDTIGGFNGMIEKQKALAGEARVTTVLFDSVSKVLYSRASLRDVKPLTEKEYYARGSTALLDAVGTAIDVVGAQLRDTPEAERPAKVIVIITTDGAENASREYSLEEVKEKIAHQKEKYSWEFLFLGADIDAFGAARSLGISADRTARYSNNAYGIAQSCRAMSDFISAKRLDLSAENWKACLEPEPPKQADGQPEKRQSRARLPKRGGNDEKQ